MSVLYLIHSNVVHSCCVFVSRIYCVFVLRMCVAYQRCVLVLCINAVLGMCVVHSCCVVVLCIRVVYLIRCNVVY